MEGNQNASQNSVSTTCASTVFPEPVIERPADQEKGQIARAELSKTNRGAVARGDWLTRNAPEMIEPVN